MISRPAGRSRSACRRLSSPAHIRAADPDNLHRHSLTASIPPRRGLTVNGLVFASNRVLHSGVDDSHGHFVAAYGVDEDASDAGSGR